jgi:hypothetical protein
VRQKKDAMFDWIIKVLVETLFQVIGAVVRFPFSRVSRWERFCQRNEERDRRLEVTRTYPEVKCQVHERGTERVRIVREGENFGAVIDNWESITDEWMPTRILGAGMVYDSPEAAEVEAKTAAPWLNAPNT